MCVYALVCLWYAHSLPDIGLRSAFVPEVKRFGGTFIATGNVAVKPKTEDRITNLGGRQVKTWPQLLQALNALQHRVPDSIDNLGHAAEQHLTYVRVNGSNWVHVEFLRTLAGGAKSSFGGWCQVGPLPMEELVPSVLWFVLKFGLFMVGALVFWKRPQDASATHFFLLAIVTLGAYMGGYHWSRIASQPILILVFMVCAVLLPAVLLHFYFIFPRPKSWLVQFPKRTLLAIYLLPLAFLTAIAVTYFFVLWFVRRGYPEKHVNISLTILLVEIYFYLGIAVLWYLASVISLVHSFRTAFDATERNQVKWLLFASLVALVPIGMTLYLAVLEPNAFGAGDGTWWMFAASVCFTLAFVIGMTRYRLMQLDQIISSGMVYFAISFVAAIVYYAVVFIGVLLGSRSGPNLSQALSVSTTALVLMLILDIVRSRLKRALDRRFYREKYQLERTLRRMGRAIEQLVDPPTLARQLLQASAEVLSVSRGAVYLRDGSPPLYRLIDSLESPPPLVELSLGCPLVEAMQVRAAVLSHAGRSVRDDPIQRQLRFLGGEVAHSLIHEGQLLGILVLGPKALGLYGAEDLNLLAAFTQLTALALKSAERHQTIEALNRELQTKVEKISEQQRRILALQTQLMGQTAAPQTAVPAPGLSPGGIIGSSQVIQQLLQLVKKVSASQSAVLIRGESGTGKELLARAVHESSSRAGKPFVKVHCAALSQGLLESELFGHVKGAFTGAHKDKIGRFEVADGGTLFLDEVGDITLEVQTKLLRVLQEMTFERVGSSEPVQVNVRLIAATHQNLEQLIATGRFREDLYYRLNVISISVPPLRERPEDIPELALHFLRLNAQRSGKIVTQIDDDALMTLKAYSWPGNIRQLENILERAVVVAEGSTITVQDLPSEIMDARLKTDTWNAGSVNGDSRLPRGTFGLRAEREDRDRRERERLVRALAATKGNKAEAARVLGLARSTLLSRLKKHGLA
jgi:transcriptional regulator with GAF, ATPase, and Fis domain